MNRISLIAALAASAITLGVSIQPAFAQAPQVRAVPAVALTDARTVVAGETLWACGADGCSTRAITARPVVACAQVAKVVGRIDSFTAGGGALTADELAKCNVRAKGGATTMARN